MKLVLGLLAAGAVTSASAQLLEFTNLTLSTSPNLFHSLTNQLNAVAYGGNSNFVAVGVNQIYVCGNFQPGQTWITSSDWVANQILPADKLDFTGIAASGNLFVATGTSNDIFSAANAFTPAGLSWSQKAKVFNNTVLAAAIAYNGGGVAAVCEAPAIGWSNTNLPTIGNWVVGTLTNIDFVESFRGVTAYGANGFAACGIAADVRLSANGTNWQAAVNGQIGEPDLFGIAYDGAQTLVAVGVTNANGVILASINSAQTNWQRVYVNNTANTPLNAVAYTGSGFIAVGNGGQVLTSPNGIAWTVQPSPANVNLYGVAFAKSGYMTGVGELVGASGTVILAGSPPPAPINPVGETNCSTFPNPPAYTGLSVTLVSDANHPVGTVTADWYDSLGNLVAAGTTNFVPTNNPDLVGANAASNIVFYAQERDLRTGFVNTNRTAVKLQIIPRPTATLTALNTTVCNIGNSFTLTNTLTGIGPWTVIWNDGTTQTANGPGPLILIRSVIPTNTFANMASNNVYYVTIVTNADMCMGNVAGDIIGTNTIVVNPRPTASLSPLSTVTCNEGDSYTLTNTLTGLGPWTVYWSDGTVQTTNGSGPVTLTRTVFPTDPLANFGSNNVYSVTVVSNADLCEGNQPGDITGSASIIVNPRPTATLAPLVMTVCNTGNSYTLTCTLTGLGITGWTVYWNDGTIQGTPGVPGPYTLHRTVSPTNTLPDAPFTNSYYITKVIDNTFGCVGDQPGDITGTNLIIVNPRPTASLTPLSTATCNEGDSYTLTNTLNGLGPWTVIWNDTTIQTTNTVSGVGPVTLVRTVYPTNSFGANAPSNNVYSVTVVSNADMCEGNQTGDITGAASIIVYPRPTATLMPLVTNVCNTGNSNTLSGTLTGLGSWTVYWNDGTIQPVSGPPPYAFTRTVFPTNTLPDAPFINNYYITNVTDTVFGCVGDQPGDITGTNLIIVNPLPTVTLTISTNDFAVTTNGVNTGLLESVSNSSGTIFNLTAGFQYLQNGTPVNIGSQILNVTNHLAFTGIAPWTVILSDGNNTVTNTFAAAGVYVWQETISTNTDTNFTFSVQSVQSTNTGCSGVPTNIYDVLVYDAPTAAAYTTNIFCGSATNTATISTALGGFGPWTNVVWSDGFTNSLVTTSPVSRTVPTPTNNTLSQIVSNYTIVSLTDKYGATTTSSNDLTGVASFIVDPFVMAAPMVPVLTNYNCPNVAAILSVAVPTNFTADWFADAGLTTSLATGTTNFDAIITNAPGTNVYYVTMRYNDAFSLTNCSPDVATNIYLVSIPCLGSITVSGTNTILSWTWNGSNILQSTTNLLPPVIWMNTYTGALGPNFLTNAVSQPPIDFFRLYTPTN